MSEVKKKTERADWPEKAWKYLTRPREVRGKLVAESQRKCYHNSTVPVKEYLEVIEKKGDPSLRSGQVGDRREKIGK
jgi:hypothetical protein